MKKAFEILGYILLELVISILLLSGFYYLFSSLILSSLGNTVEFSFSYFWLIILRFTPACAILSVMFLIFSFIKRNCTFRESILPYVIITVLVWIVLVPLSLMYDSGTIKGITWWVARIKPEMNTTGLFTIPTWTAWLIGRFEILHTQLAVFFKENLSAFSLMQYASFFLSLAAIGCFSRFSSWRLWNAFFVIIAFCVSIVLNSYMFDVTFMNGFGLTDFWMKWLPLFVNVLIFIFNTGLGAVLMIADKKRRLR